MLPVVARTQDGQRIVAIVLGTAAVFGYALCRQDAHRVALLTELACPGLCAGAGFHQDGHARWQAA